MFLAFAGIANAVDGLRIATFHTGLKRQGPGLLVRDILSGSDPQVLLARDMIVATQPDIIFLTRFDFDLGHVALDSFAKILADAGVHYPYSFSKAPNSGVATGFDINGDGWNGDAVDAQGYGAFPGQGGMAVLSVYPIDADGVQDLSSLLWGDVAGEKFRVQFDQQRLSSVGHWDVPVLVPGWDEPIHLLAYHAGTPAFDRKNRRNFYRNADENQLWSGYLDGSFGGPPPMDSFVILGDSNLDPYDGEGDRQVMMDLLGDPRIQDPEPSSSGASEASRLQGGPNRQHKGDPALDTADFRDEDGPGNLRVDYVLPSSELTVTNSGVFWPAEDDPQASMLSQRKADTSWHGLVWVDIAR